MKQARSQEYDDLNMDYMEGSINVAGTYRDLQEAAGIYICMSLICSKYIGCS